MPSRNRTSNANAKANTSKNSPAANSTSTATSTSTTTPSAGTKPAAATTSSTSPSNPSSAAASSSSITTTTATKSQTKSQAQSQSQSQSQSEPTLPRNATNLIEISNYLWHDYLRITPQRTKLLDIFLGFLAVVGAVQFVYCVVAGSYPYNAFLSGFSATVGQFVLTVSLRMQTTRENRAAFKGLSDERAFADYVFGSLLLHFFCINFIN